MKKLISKLIEKVKRQDGWGIAELLSVMVGIVVVVVIMAPAIKGFSDSVIKSLTTWWTSIQSTLFSA